MIEKRTAGSVLIERYRYTEHDDPSETAWWLIRDVCILSRDDQIFTLESAEEIEEKILEQAIQAMSQSRWSRG